MYPKLYNSDGLLLAVLNNIIKDTAVIKRVVNGEFTFTFEAYEEELKSEYFNIDNTVVLEDQTFDIKYIEQTHKTEVKYNIQCEHVNYRLLDGDENYYEDYLFTGTPTQVLSNILQGTEFSVGVVEFTDNITITASDIDKKTLIYQVANLVGGEVEYTNSGFTINILNTIGQDNGFQVRFGKNLLGIKKIIDSRGDFKVSYSVDIVELKNSNEYIEKQLQGLEVIGVGDTIRIVDEVIGLDVQNRIVSIEYNPIFAVNTKLEIANTIDTIADRIKEIETKTVKMDTLYNKVSISNEYGFRAERSDLKARIDMNATEGLSVFTRPTVEESYVKNLTIDADGNIVMTGKINVVSGSNLGLGSLAYEDYVDWDTNLIHIPNALQSPSGEGLFISSDHLGYYNSATGGWRTYMDIEGNFYLGGAAGKLQWNSNLNTLTISGTLTNNKAGITDEGTLDTAVRFWAGDTYANRNTAKFKVTQGGVVTMTDAVVKGNIYGSKFYGSSLGSSYLAIGDSIDPGLYDFRMFRNDTDTQPSFEIRDFGLSMALRFKKSSDNYGSEFLGTNGTFSIAKGTWEFWDLVDFIGTVDFTDATITGDVRKIHIGTSAPTLPGGGPDTTKLWLDTN